MSVDENEFERWLRENQDEIGLNFDDVDPSDPDLNWCRQVYEEDSKISKATLRSRVLDQRRMVSREAILLFLPEVERERGVKFVASIVEKENLALKGRRDLTLFGHELYALSLESALVDVAEIVQEKIIERDEVVWPVCGEHNTGLHPILLNGAAVWWCKSGSHSAGRIVSN